MAVAALTLASAGPLFADSAWEALTRFRAALEEQDRFTADFRQSYLPAGFSTPELESGSLAADLPECLRWDYDQPFPKSFLLCRGTLWYWSPGESRGERHPIDDRDAPGLDFLLLDLAELRQRYSAELETLGDGGLRLTLRPRRPTAELVEAAVELAPGGEQLRTLLYLDAEGNESRFELDRWQRGSDPESFDPPENVQWDEP
jgi:hypothetical protein